MLWNPELDKSEKDLSSLDVLIGWLEKKPRGEYYPYCDGANCLLGTYYRENGLKKASVTATHLITNNGSLGTVLLPPSFDDIARGKNCHPTEWNYGQALDRALEVKGRLVA